MGLLSSFMHPERGYEAAEDQLQQGWQDAQKYYGQEQGYLSPFMQHGEQAYGNLSGAMGQLLDPEALENKWASGYQESPYAKQQQEMAKQSGLDAASSMGLMGSSPALGAIQAGTAQIGARDRQNYLNDLMQKYLAGAGIAGNIYGTGARAAGQLGQGAMQMGGRAMDEAQRMAEMEYGRQNAPGNLFGNLLQGGLNLGTSYLTGGMGTGNYGRGAWSPTGGY